jgi:phytoene dehydrogenase-like protein
MALTVVQLGRKVAGYPIGGSLDLAEALARRYTALGGRVHYSARVAQILTAEGRAVGVRLAEPGGREFPADVVISAADGRSTLFDLLDGDYVDETTRGYYRSLPASESILQISLGVARDFSAEPPSLSFALRRPIWLGDREFNRLVVKHYSFDPTMADPGKACLSVWAEADYGYWSTLRQNPARYEAEKEKVARAVIDALDEHYPGLAGQVEAVDVATPITYERYTANWHGAIHGWAMGARKMALMMGTGMRKTLPDLKDFYMIGQWVEPGGNAQLAAASGRDVMEMICRADGRPFITTPPAAE